jgi:hypothetical protein
MTFIKIKWLSNSHTTKVIFVDTVKMTPPSKAQYWSYKIPAVTLSAARRLYSTHSHPIYLRSILIFYFRVRLELEGDFFPPVPQSLPEKPSSSDCISYTLLCQILIITGHNLNFFHVWGQAAHPVKQRTLYPTYLNKIVNCQFNNTQTCAVVALCRIQLQTKMNLTIPKRRILENGLALKNNFPLNLESLFLIYT